MQYHVLKFGGTSLADPDAIRRAAGILERDPCARVAVVSAPGKRYPGDEKVTDALIRIHRIAREGGDYIGAFRSIVDRFLSIAAGLGLSGVVLREIRGAEAFLPLSPAAAASRGEYLSARIFAEYTGWEFLDAEGLIAFSDTGEFLPAETRENIRSAVHPEKRYVIPGFYGSSPSGFATFSRGGSDETGSVAAAALCADLYENWTDVDGLYSGDPALVANTRTVPEIGYAQMRMAACLGAGVLSPDSIPHAAAAGIPIRIRNTFRPDAPGTLVSGAESDPRLVAGRRGLALRSGSGFVSLSPSLHLAPAGEGDRALCGIWRLGGGRMPVLPDAHILTEKAGGQLIVAEEAEFLRLIRQMHGMMV